MKVVAHQSAATTCMLRDMAIFFLMPIGRFHLGGAEGRGVGRGVRGD